MSLPLAMQYYYGDMYADGNGNTGMLTLPPVPVQADIDQYTAEQTSNAADSHAQLTAVQNGQHGGVMEGKHLWLALGGVLLLLIILHL